MFRRVKRITRCEKDAKHLQDIRTNWAVSQESQPEHYKGVVVVKPWGHEFLIFANEQVAIWFLSIKKGHSTSMHCHPTKLTSLVLLSGTALCSTFTSRNFLSTGDTLMLEPGVFHSTKSLSTGGISVIEIETPPAKLDLLRLDDSYGRQERGYEGLQEMVSQNLEEFDYFYADGAPAHGTKINPNEKFSISLERYSCPDGVNSLLKLDPGSLYGVCSGAIIAPDKSVIVRPGEVERGAYIESLGGATVDGETILVKITVYE